MAEFTLDTSGYVGPTDLPNGTQALAVTWSHLDPFGQGYIEALFATPEGTREGRGLAACGYGFRHLAPETMAAILRDCANWKRDFGRSPNWDTRHGGEMFWHDRQTSALFGRGYGPLTPYLGDDGRVYLRERAA